MEEAEMYRHQILEAAKQGLSPMKPLLIQYSPPQTPKRAINFTFLPNNIKYLTSNGEKN
jgi:hypothetical protein